MLPSAGAMVAGLSKVPENSSLKHSKLPSVRIVVSLKSRRVVGNAYRRRGAIAIALTSGAFPAIFTTSAPSRAQSAMRFRISAGPRATIRSPGASCTSWPGFAETSLPGVFSARIATPAYRAQASAIVRLSR
jgi:hypothetical protein